MRLAILTGLIYIAYSINPTYMTGIEKNTPDMLFMGLCFFLTLFGDLKDLFSEKVK